MAKIIDLLFNSYFTPFLVIGLIVLAIFLFRKARWLFRRLIVPMVIMMFLGSLGTVNAVAKTFIAPAQKFAQTVSLSANAATSDVVDGLANLESIEGTDIIADEISEPIDNNDITVTELTTGLGSIFSGDNFNHLINFELDEIDTSWLMPLAEKVAKKRDAMSEKLTEKFLNSNLMNEIKEMCIRDMSDPAILYGGQDLSKYE